MSATAPTINVSGVRHGYDGATVLNDINFSVTAGEFVTIVGHSGCGKSTLLRLLVGAERPMAGTVTINGEPKTKPDQSCGIVYQTYSVYPHLTVRENILFGLQAVRGPVTHGSAEQQATHYLKQMGLEDSGHKYPYQLSGGMGQRVAIAQALIAHPPVLLLDEPFSALDSWRRQQLQLFLLDLYRQEKMTVIFVTHDLKEAVFMGTRVVVLSKPGGINHGAQVLEGSKIILDVKINHPHPRPPEFKTSAEFNELVAHIGKVAAGGKD